MGAEEPGDWEIPDIRIKCPRCGGCDIAPDRSMEGWVICRECGANWKIGE